MVIINVRKTLDFPRIVGRRRRHQRSLLGERKSFTEWSKKSVRSICLTVDLPREKEQLTGHDEPPLNEPLFLFPELRRHGARLNTLQFSRAERREYVIRCSYVVNNQNARARKRERASEYVWINDTPNGNHRISQRGSGTGPPT